MSAHTEAQPIPVIADEPPAIRIAKALSALVAALPGVNHVSVHAGGSVTFSCETDEATRAIAAQLGLEMVEVANSQARWLAAKGATYRWVGALPIGLYGPHHEIVPVPPIDEQQVEAALAQAEAAL